MANISHQLMIKYGLRGGPSQALVDKWVQRTEALIREGTAAEAAGRQAAREIFPDFDTVFYRSEADTLAALLARARDKE